MCKLRGFYTIKREGHPDTRFENLITDTGWNTLMYGEASTKLVSAVILGEDSSPISESTAQINREIQRQDYISYSVSLEKRPFSFYKAVFSFKASDLPRCYLTTLGIASSDGVLFSATKVKDKHGNETPLQIAAGEGLTIIYELYWILSEEPTTFIKKFTRIYERFDRKIEVPGGLVKVVPQLVGYRFWDGRLSQYQFLYRLATYPEKNIHRARYFPQPSIHVGSSLFEPLRLKVNETVGLLDPQLVFPVSNLTQGGESTPAVRLDILLAHVKANALKDYTYAGAESDLPEEVSRAILDNIDLLPMARAGSALVDDPGSERESQVEIKFTIKLLPLHGDILTEHFNSPFTLLQNPGYKPRLTPWSLDKRRLLLNFTLPAEKAAKDQTIIMSTSKGWYEIKQELLSGEYSVISDKEGPFSGQDDNGEFHGRIRGGYDFFTYGIEFER